MLNCESLEGFDFKYLHENPLHIIGCGAIGSALYVELIRVGVPAKNITLYDFDVVEEHNITTQRFYKRHVGLLKTEALINVVEDILGVLPIEAQSKQKGRWLEETSSLDGIVFVCVDVTATRIEILQDCQYNYLVTKVINLGMSLSSSLLDLYGTVHIMNPGSDAFVELLEEYKKRETPEEKEKIEDKKNKLKLCRLPNCSFMPCALVGTTIKHIDNTNETNILL